jgi:hypothetical protein
MPRSHAPTGRALPSMSVAGPELHWFHARVLALVIS